MQTARSIRLRSSATRPSMNAAPMPPAPPMSSGARSRTCSHRSHSASSPRQQQRPLMAPAASADRLSAGSPRGMHEATDAQQTPPPPDDERHRANADQATQIQQSIARIHEACQAPALAPAEYRVLFDVMAQEITANGLQGAQTLVNITQRAREFGLDIKRDDLRFIYDVVSESDPWFEQGTSASSFCRPVPQLRRRALPQPGPEPFGRRARSDRSVVFGAPATAVGNRARGRIRGRARSRPRRSSKPLRAGGSAAQRASSGGASKRGVSTWSSSREASSGDRRMPTRRTKARARTSFRAS